MPKDQEPKEILTGTNNPFGIPSEVVTLYGYFTNHNPELASFFEEIFDAEFATEREASAARKIALIVAGVYKTKRTLAGETGEADSCKKTFYPNLEALACTSIKIELDNHGFDVDSANALEIVEKSDWAAQFVLLKSGLISNERFTSAN